MPAASRPPRRDQERSGAGMAAAGIAAMLAIVCCAGPALVAVGGLGAIGGFLRNPLVIAAAALLLAVAVTAVIRRRRSGRDACCPPAAQNPAGRDRSHVPADQEGPQPR